jgi:xanthine dehydrogenase accessory factor
MNRSSAGIFSSDLSVSEVLAEISGEPAVLIQVMQTQGSAPRDAGTWMAVTRDRFYNTIGGGHLEFEAIAMARDMIAKGASEPLDKKFTLGASLGQCCGGVMQLRFERLPELVADSGPVSHSGSSEVAVGSREGFLRAAFGGFATPLQTVALVGGGHVGHAIVQALLPLPFSIQWADSREEIFPRIRHERLHMAQFDEITECIATFPGDSLLLVMSFTHAEDLGVVRAALARRRREPGCFPFVGLIGSKTKWAKFRHRLSERGFTESELAAVTCPIGITGITGKQPAVIAASVAAQLLQF